jgi:uncharacterized protein YbaR (Trm112 family)
MMQMPLDPRLLAILCCPAEHQGVPCHGELEELPEGLRCVSCGLLYPIQDGIPVLLSELAVPMDKAKQDRSDR